MRAGCQPRVSAAATKRLTYHHWVHQSVVMAHDEIDDVEWFRRLGWVDEVPEGDG